jgi:beta-phosphoglucomutase-like phosphatase (HAD superfamily)
MRKGCIKGLVFDNDGVIGSSEEPKAAGWMAGTLSATGRMAVEDLARLRAGDVDLARRVYPQLRRQYSEEMRFIRSLSGRSRDETCSFIQDRLVKPFTGDDDSTALYQGREAAKDILLAEFTQPIRGTHEFIGAIRGLWPLAIVTQTDRATIDLLARRGVVPIDSFTAVVCCGGDRRFEAIPGSKEKKTAAYMEACRVLGVPPALALCCEDSVDGLDAARAASLLCLGLKQPGNPQDLARHADLVLSDLAPLAAPGVIELLASTPAGEVMARLRSALPGFVVA